MSHQFNTLYLRYALRHYSTFTSTISHIGTRLVTALKVPMLTLKHRDFCAYNLMMDASELLPGGHHFAAPYKAPDGRSSLVFRDRADVSPVQYFVIDLGLAAQMQDNDGLVTGVYGQDKSVPELSWDVPYNPFKVDVYQLGNVILQDMLGVRIALSSRC